MVMGNYRDPVPSNDLALIDQNEDAGKPQPYPINPRGSYPETIDDANPVGDIVSVSADAQHREVIASLAKSENATRAILDALLQVGWEIIRVDAGAVPQSQHPKMRVQYVIISRATAGTATLLVGTGQYPFDVQAAPVRVDFPLVVERGVDLAMTGDGRLYLVGPTE